MSSALHSRLLGILKRELDSKKLQLPPYCTQQLETMVGHGIQRIRTQNATENTAIVLRAERNLRGLIKYFGDTAREAGTYPHLSESAFDSAMVSCPTYWPYTGSG